MLFFKKLIKKNLFKRKYVQHSKNKFCSYCGNEFEENIRKQSIQLNCSVCGKTTFQNPIPVALLLVQVNNGVLLGRRNIYPKKGSLCIPGGFIEINETWEEAAKRELFEETGLEVESSTIKHFETTSIKEQNVLLIFGYSTKILKELPVFKPNNETTEIVVTEKLIDLAFSSHTDVLRKFLKKINQEN
jgi:ADP-ribose pyrophosphatase YjhB (NUDIX family)